LSVEKSDEPANPAAISVVWLPDYCESFAANRSGVFGNEPLRVAFGDGWRLEAIDSAAVKTSPLATKLPETSAPVAAEPDARKPGPKKKGPDAADGLRFFKRVTTKIGRAHV